MNRMGAEEILQRVMSEPRRRCWPAKRQSALLVNVDSAVLSCVLDDPEKLAVIEPIEGFRSLDEDMQAIVDKLEHVESVRKSGERLSKTQKGRLREGKSKRREASRSPSSSRHAFRFHVPVRFL